ncbi:MAG: DUF4393 domain-containing protein [Candidatus Brocadiaceae bacterium]|nr:DUF4393 domain-containing protein [Candidatus Brocadiaceae bacterium]
MSENKQDIPEHDVKADKQAVPCNSGFRSSPRNNLESKSSSRASLIISIFALSISIGIFTYRKVIDHIEVTPKAVTQNQYPAYELGRDLANPEAEEIAKAVQSVAKFGEKSLETSEKLGGFFARVFNEPIAEVSGMITDKLRFVRWQRLVQMSDDVNKILKERGVKETQAVPPKLALPIFEEGSLENDENIQQMWNHLLANAMDPQFNGELRYGFIDIIKNITGIEAVILNNFYEILKRDGYIRDLANITNYSLKKEQIMKMVSIDENTYQVSIFNLMRMQCIGPAILKGGISMGNEPITIYKGTDAVVLTPLGVKFIEACIK